MPYRADNALALELEPRRSSRAAQAAMRLIELAESGEPGTRLGTKSELRNLCDVSVGTFNEALKLAQSRGAIVLRPGPGGGLFVGEPTPMVRLGNSILAIDEEETSVAEAVRLRNALDPLLVQDALTYVNSDTVAQMRSVTSEMKKAITRNEPLDFVRANWRLHAVIASISPNQMLKSIYLTLLAIVERHTLSVMPAQNQPLPDYIEQRFQLHLDLVEAIAAGNEPEAMLLIAEHNTDAKRPE